MRYIKIIFFKILYKYTTFISRNFLGLTNEKGVIFKKIPLVLKHPSAFISIGKNTTINSDNFGYHINMFSRCKLYADHNGARITIGENCRIHGACIHAYHEIEIGDNCLIAANTQIIDANGHQLCMDNPKERLIKSDKGKKIIIQDNVWVASNCTILGGTIIGEGAVITAGSIVKGVVPARSLYGGVPAKLIKQY